MSNVIQFRKLPDIGYGIEIDQEYGAPHYQISLRRYPDKPDKIMIIMICNSFEELDDLREAALQEARKGYAAICSGKNPYNWNINFIAPDMKNRAECCSAQL